jgi:hypothetical protein
MTLQTHLQASHIAFVNGQMVQANELKAQYDGKHLAIDINENGRHFAKMLDNKDIERILATPAHKVALEQRLHRDFLGQKSKKRREKSKKNKSKNKSKKNKSIKKSIKKRK